MRFIGLFGAATFTVLGNDDTIIHNHICTIHLHIMAHNPWKVIRLIFTVGFLIAEYYIILYWKMNVVNLFNAIRGIANIPLTQPQVDSVNAILSNCTKHAVNDNHQIAYILATAYHEARLKPIAEIGKGAGHSYGNPDPITGQIYYGRGLVQLTWKGNYEAFGKILGVDLVKNPDLALNTTYAAEIIVVGMKGGMFTGVGLNKYFTGTTAAPINARRIINGIDSAELIAGYYQKILTAITS